MRCRRAFAPGLLVVALVAATFGSVRTAAASTITAAPAACPAQAATEALAITAAARCGGQVEIEAAATETDTVWANPNGTISLRRTIAPKRVRQPGGGWAPVDTALVVALDGSLRPRSVPATIRFSGGGNGPFATMTTADGTVQLSWPKALPAPRAEGDTAVYVDALPEVDLRVRALSTGFTYVLVVKTREAAASPALRSLRLPFASDKLTMRDHGTSVEIVDRTGKAIFAGGAASMWDSSKSVPRSDTGAAVADKLRGRSGQPADSNPDEPGETARRAHVGTRTTGAALELTPDAGMLASPDTSFPVFIDPPVWYAAWAYAKTGASDNELPNEVWAGLNPSDGEIYRGYFLFGLDGLAGRTILGASFGVTLKHTYLCDQTATTLVRTDNPTGHRSEFVAERAWIGEPFWANAHKISNGVPVCWNDPQPDVWIYWSANLAGEVQAMAPSGYITLSVTAGSYNTDEGEQGNWRKFWADSAVLDVTANALPSVTGMSTSPSMPCVTGSGRPVVRSIPQLSAVVADPEGGTAKAKYEWWTTGGSIIGSTVTQGASGATLPPAIIPPGDLQEGGTYSWRVQAGDAYDWGGFSGWCEFTVDTLAPTALDTTPPSSCVSTTSGTDTANLPRVNADNGGAGIGLKGIVDDLNGGTVQAQFEWWPKATKGSSGMIGTATTNPPVASHSVITTPVAATAFADGSAYSWRMRGLTNGVAKQWGPWCEFVVDNTAPGNPTVTAGPDNDLSLAPPGTTPGAAGSNAIIGRPTHITLVPAGGTDPNVVAYLWGINTSSPQRWAPAAANGTALITVEPIVAGLTTNKLTVLAVDRAGNRSPLPSGGFTTAFKAQSGVATGWWPTKDSASPVTDVLNSHPFTISGGPTVGQGMISVNAAGDAASPSSVVATNASFTVSAWARINGTGDWQAILSQDGSLVAGFYLQYQQASQRFRFSVPTADNYNPTLIETWSTATVQRGSWYHLVGVYDATAGQLRLYVNGTLNATAAWAGPAISATGALRVGRLKYNGGLVNWLSGDVADVRTWNKPLDTTGIANLAKLPPPAGQWAMEDTSTATATDGSGLAAAYPVAMTGAYSPVAGHTGTALHLDGLTGQGNTTGSVVATNTSFTVSAWVRMAAKGSHSQTVVTQLGSGQGAFYLCWDAGADRLAFTMTSADSATPTWQYVLAGSAPVLGMWIHLTGVYDQLAGTVKLYVNGVLQGTRTGVVAWNATGALRVGDGPAAVGSTALSGDVDDVRIFKGVLSDAQITYLASL